MFKTILITLFIASTSFLQDDPFVKVKITKNISAQLPKVLTPMTDDMLADKYASYRKPLAMYADQTGLVNFGVNMTNALGVEDDLPILKGMYKGSISSLYSKVEFIQDTIQTINKRKFIVFEFVSRIEALPEEKETIKSRPIKQYHYIQYAIIDKRVYIFNFNCPENLKEIWQPLAKKIMQTIKIRG